jgi:hypothetical protein
MESRRRFALPAGLVLVVCLAVVSFVADFSLDAASLPGKLSDREFWQLSSDLSEPNGFFRSDNLLSNESGFQYILADLTRTARPGRAYMGVGPEQNFTYIVALKPAMVFIVDVRRGNLHLQLMYKALFELSADRADFVSRLFSKKRPEGLNAKSSAQEIFTAFWDVETSDDLYHQNLDSIRNHLTKKHGFALVEEDLQGIEYVYHAFYWYGPRIQYSSTGSFGGTFQPNYAALMGANDGNGQERGYLASDENFTFMKSLEARNLLVPVVGNFAGPKAIRSVGRYLKEKGGTVSAFYLSNVEQYLRQDNIWRDFCENVAALPLDETSTFIRSVRAVGGAQPSFGLSSELGNMISEIRDCRP